MARAQQRLIVILVVLFLGLYFLNHNFYFGHWFHLWHMSWGEWLLLGLGIWLVITCLSTSPLRRDGEHIEDSRGRYSNREILNRLDGLYKEITELRYQRDHNKSNADTKSFDEKLNDLASRIEALDKTVNARR